MIGRDATELRVGRRRAHAVEEDADFELPSLQVRAQDLDLVVVGDLFGAERLGVMTDPELTLTCRAQVLDPLRLAAWRDQITLAFVGEQVHRRGAPLTARTPADAQLA